MDISIAYGNGYSIQVTAQDITDEQREQITAELTRTVKWAERVASKRDISMSTCVRDHVDAITHYNNPLYTNVTVTFASMASA